MFILVDLRDHEDKSHDSFEYEFEAQATMKQLKDLISSSFHISLQYQRIFDSNGRRIDMIRGALENAGLRDSETAIVKHSELSNWSALVDCESAFQQAHEEEHKKAIHARSTVLFKALADSLFYATYGSFNSRCESIEKKFLTSFDRKLEAIKSCCRVYFKKMYGEKVKVTFESREHGSRAGYLCILDDGSTIDKYYIKTQHGAGDKSSHTRYDIELKELFVYKLLEQLEIGAEIHFIDNESFSNWVIYIGSREIEGFKTLEYLEMAQPDNLKEYSKSVVQMLFVFSVLMLADHHTANMGLDSGASPYIVDFFIVGKPLTSVKDLHDSVRMAKKFNITLGTFDERLKISTEYLKDSNFSAIFESSIDSFLQDQKSVLDKSLLVVDDPQKTNDLKEYFENVRKNIKLFDDYSFNE